MSKLSYPTYTTNPKLAHFLRRIRNGEVTLTPEQDAMLAKWNLSKAQLAEVNSKLNIVIRVQGSTGWSPEYTVEDLERGIAKQVIPKYYRKDMYNAGYEFKLIDVDLDAFMSRVVLQGRPRDGLFGRSFNIADAGSHNSTLGWEMLPHIRTFSIPDGVIEPFCKHMEKWAYDKFGVHCGAHDALCAGTKIYGPRDERDEAFKAEMEKALKHFWDAFVQDTKDTLLSAAKNRKNKYSLKFKITNTRTLNAIDAEYFSDMPMYTY